MSASSPEKSSLEKLSPMPELLKEDRRIAFGRVVMPYFFGLDEKDYNDITPAMREAISPNKILPYILPHTTGEFVVDGVALDADEYQAVPRSVDAFRKSITNKTQGARSQQQVDLRRSAAARSGVHALESKRDTLKRLINAVDYELDTIVDLRGRAKSPGYAHRKAIELSGDVSYVYNFSFNRILNVMSREKKWNATQEDLARRSLDWRLFFDGQLRVGNWRGMLGVAKVYATQRRALFEDRIGLVDLHIRQTETQ